MRLLRRLRGRARVTADTVRLKAALVEVRRRTGRAVTIAGVVDLALDVLLAGLASGAVDLSGQPRAHGQEIHEA